MAPILSVKSAMYLSHTLSFVALAAAVSASLAMSLEDSEIRGHPLQETLRRCKDRVTSIRGLHASFAKHTRQLCAELKGLRTVNSAQIGTEPAETSDVSEMPRGSRIPMTTLHRHEVRATLKLRGGTDESVASNTTKKAPHNFDYDYFVIGGGSGGVRSARIAASHGAKVALAEEASGGDSAEGGFGGLGGTCVNVGCVPKKLMVYGSHYSQDFEDARAYGWDVKVERLDWPRFVANKNKEIARLNGIYANMLKNAGVTVIRGRATFIDAHTVEVNGKPITADKILIAVGGWPSKPDIPGADLGITSNEAFFLPTRPDRAIIVGGGYIAVEFAEILHGYGCNVTLLYRGDLWLRGFDRDVREHLAAEYRAKGIDVRFYANVAALAPAPGGGVRATLTGAGAGGDTLDADAVLFATGRRPRTAGLGCARAGVVLDAAGAVVVDDGFRTTAGSVYAVGDVIDRVALTPVALAEGHCLADTLFGGRPRKTDYSDIPTAVFSGPPVGAVGLTEEAARAEAAHAGRRPGAVHVYRTAFRGMRHTLTGRPERVLMKLVVDGDSDRVLGVHMVGPEAGEVIQLAGVCLKAGATKAHFDATIGVHPTAAEEFVTMRTRLPDPPPQAPPTAR